TAKMMAGRTEVARDVLRVFRGRAVRQRVSPSFPAEDRGSRGVDLLLRRRMLLLNAVHLPVVVVVDGRLALASVPDVRREDRVSVVRKVAGDDRGREVADGIAGRSRARHQPL